MTYACNIFAIPGKHWLERVVAMNTPDTKEMIEALNALIQRGLVDVVSVRKGEAEIRLSRSIVR